MPTALITGANRGIGLRFARRYGADGWRVLATCRNPNTAGELSEVEGDLQIEALDVTDQQRVDDLAESLGGEAIDVLINNAGIAARNSGTFGELDPYAWSQGFRVNTIAPLLIAQAFVEHVAASDRRKMAFVTSRLGSIALNEDGGRYAYRSSKAALNMACKSLAADLAPRGITVAVFHPGWVRTDMGGPGAPVTPEDSAAGMCKVIEGLTLADSGGFFDYDGDRVPW
jgi:NAD(P)-dependent dehydrogenase (short-subunit alcohol dehydrogenase family)